MNIINVNLSTIKLEENCILRIPPRKEEDQQENYKKLFDYNTLFADIFMIEDAVELIGPPLLNLEPIFKKARIFLDGFEFNGKIKIESIHRKCRVTIPTKNKVSKIKLIYEEYVFNRDVQPNYYEEFRGCNVLVTQSRDNPIEWIIYWIMHHVVHHKIDSVIIYDNNSSLYTAEELKTQLSKIEELKNLCVINWDIPYGVTGGDKAIWDSDFGQYQSWEHAYSRLLRKANCVIIDDIDELILHKDGMAIPDFLELIDESVVRFKRRQIVEVASNYGEVYLPRMHCLTHLYEKDKPLWAPKYAFKPNKIQPDTHFLVHDVIGSKTVLSDDILGRHFGCLRIHWRMENYTPIIMREKNSFKVDLEEDLELLSSFSKIDIDKLRQYLAK
ncbi:hypothetical protein QG082_03855 [Kingella kingae]|uniref:hypothetical protein n=1 Tax=Kingella kingae TaxID=504 RepID=UPI00254AA1E5|nr:hypothetical protein [Kingella kingae]MDK4527990.1 hypothetical protein [Kingella kingae]MDK4542666.1 hypothetical protein [Kingella kingae]MDK4562073.1 hypothetical protein [Kingella kingae]MDK4564077.1 hypothetical protein [Kingella kingae]MDK4577737.1 hypothetical protein [Kingella kingae]